MKKTLLFSLLLPIICTSCLKTRVNNENVFPAETQEGKNTFGCFINGQAFIAATTLFGLVRPVNVYYYKDSTAYHKAGFLSINGTDARSSMDIAGDIMINKQQVFGTGTYNLQPVANCGTANGCDDIVYSNVKANKPYFGEYGTLTVTKLDTLNKIVSGRFSFVAKDTLGNSVQITAGRFDAKYLN